MGRLKNISFIILVAFITVFGFSRIAQANTNDFAFNTSEYLAILNTLVVNKTINSTQATNLTVYFNQKELEKNSLRQKTIDEIMTIGSLNADQADIVFKTLHKEGFNMVEGIDNVFDPLVKKQVISPEQAIKLYTYFSDIIIDTRGKMIEELSANTDLSVDEAEEVLKLTHWSEFGPDNSHNLNTLLSTGIIIEDDIDDVISYYQGLKYDQQQKMLQELIASANLTRSQAKAVLKAINKLPR